MLILQLIFAHLLGDFVFQTNTIFARKYKSWHGTLEHAAIIGVCTLFALMPYWGDARAWLILGIIFGLHFVQDVLKVEYDKKYNKKHHSWPYFMDQVCHLGLILVLGLSFPNLEQLPMPVWYYGNYFSPVVMSFLIALILVSYTFDVTAFQFNKDKVFRPNYHAMLQRILALSLSTAILLLVVNANLGA